jgi:hypothetical protein
LDYGLFVREVTGRRGAGTGVDEATSVTEDYKERENKFTITICKVTIELKPKPGDPPAQKLPPRD